MHEKFKKMGHYARRIDVDERSIQACITQGRGDISHIRTYDQKGAWGTQKRFEETNGIITFEGTVHIDEEGRVMSLHNTKW